MFMASFIYAWSKDNNQHVKQVNIIPQSVHLYMEPPIIFSMVCVAYYYSGSGLVSGALHTVTALRPATVGGVVERGPWCDTDMPYLMMS